MAGELDKATEARRKALRNGEEDPIVVAQRFLNIYRQMHIFSPERKEAFDKMLLELPPDIRGIFASLPGGAMLQDYVDDLAEKSGVQKAVHNTPEIHLNEEAHQQAQILATALAKAQSQTGATVAPAAVSGSAKLAIDKDFAGEFAKIMGGVLQQQSTMQKESLEKLAVDLSKTQLFIAKSMKETKDEQRQELGQLCKTIAEGYQNSREEQRQEIGELCKTIAQSQTALSASLSSIRHDTPAPASSTPLPAYDDSSTKKLIEVVLDGQKQINLRLDKVEELSLNKANDNRELIAAFEKSQAEMIKSLSNLQTARLPVQTDNNDEKLVQLISESQEKLVRTLLSANFQQNNTNTAQSNNNANNIQINTPDNSAQMLLLIDKIASLQNSNEQNLEKAITTAIEAQGRLYDKISRQQTKELAKIIADSLKEINRPVYMMPPEQPLPSASVYQAPPAFDEEEVYSKPDVQPEVSTVDEKQFSRIPPDLEGEEINYDILQSPVPENPVVWENDEADTDIISDEIVEPSSSEEINNFVANEAGEPKKKKKKRKKKKKKSFENGELVSSAETEISLPTDDLDIESLSAGENDVSPLIEEAAVLDDMPVVSREDEVPSVEENAETLPDPLPASEILEIQENINQNNTEDKDSTLDWNTFNNEQEITVSGDDWGFGGATVSEPVAAVSDGSNDNEEEQDWEWAYVEDGDGEDYPQMEAIGDNSYICSGDLYAQEKILDNSSPIVYGGAPIEINSQPLIFDNTDEAEFIDPYQNSILKD